MNHTGHEGHKGRTGAGYGMALRDAAASLVGSRWALPAALLVAFALRVYRLGDSNIWWDEGLAIWAVRKSFWGTTLWTAQDVHPPLYFWHLWPWVRLVGESEFAARFISVIWGVLTVAVVYALGKRLGGRRVGLVSALFLALARFHIWWSQEMRMYILATLAATVTLYAAVRWFEAERAHPNLRWLLGYVLGATAGLYTLYMAGLAPLVANLYALVALARTPRPRRWRTLGLWSAAQVSVLLLLVPWLALALPRMNTWSVAQPFSFRQLLSLYSILLTIGVSTDVQRYLLYALPFGLTLLAGLATLAWPRRRPEPGLPGAQAALLLTAAVASLPALVFILTRPRSLFYTPRVEARYLVLFAPAFAVFLAWSVVRLARRVPLLGGAALAACLGLTLAFVPGHYQDRYLRDEMETMARMLGAHARPEDAVLLISGNRYPEFGYYYERLVPVERRGPVLRLPRDDRFTGENITRQLEEATAGRSRFWVAIVEPGIQDPDGLALPWLDRHYERALTYPMGYNALILYDNSAAGLLVPRSRVAPQRPLHLQQSGLEIMGYDLPARECKPGDRVHLGVYYASRAPLTVEMRWLQSDGELLYSVTQEWPASGDDAGRAAVQYTAWPWCRGGHTRFELRWAAPGQAGQIISLPGPRILAPAGRPPAERVTRPLQAAFEQGITLRGFDLQPASPDGLYEVKAGTEMPLDLFWEAKGPVSEDYTVFTQLVGSAHNPKTNGPLWGQHDGPPVGALYPTSHWLPGQLILDRHALAIDPAAPPGDYELWAGLYRPGSGERLRLVGADGTPGDDHVVLGRVRVVE